MNETKNTPSTILWVVCYALTLGLALYLKQPEGLLHPPLYLALSWSLGGLVLAMLFTLIVKRKEECTTQCWAGIAFFAIQGLVSWAVATYIFNAPWMLSLVVATGSLVGLVLWLSLGEENNFSWNRILSAALLVVGFVASLRLGKVWGGLLFATAILNGGILGCRALSPSAKNAWKEILFSAALLAAGRALIQYYLLMANIPSVTIAQTYSFAALFLGVFIPMVDDWGQRQKTLHSILSLIVFGILAPLAVGFFLHVRPTGAYMLGLFVSAFAVGVLQWKSARMALLGLLNLGTLCLGLPYFLKANAWTRIERLEVLGLLFALALIALFLNQRLQKSEANTELTL